MSAAFVFIFTTIASTTGFVVVSILILASLVRQKHYRLARIYLFATAALMLTVQALKETFQVARPDNSLIEAAGYALPSGHAAGSLYLALMLSYFASTLTKPWRYGVYVVCGVLAGLIGYSRYVLGVHTPFQIAVGYGIAVVFAVACIVLMRRTKKSD